MSTLALAAVVCTWWQTSIAPKNISYWTSLHCIFANVLAADLFLTIVLHSQSLQRGLHYTSTQAKNQVESRLYGKFLK